MDNLPSFITVSNKFIESKLRDLSARQMKLLMLVGEKMQQEYPDLKPENLDPDKAYRVNFPVSQLRASLGMGAGHVIEMLDRLGIQSVSYKVEDEDGKRWSMRAPVFAAWGIEDQYNGEDGRQMVRVHVMGPVFGFLLLLQGNYTKLYPEEILHLESKYTIRLYQLLRKVSQQGTPKRTYELEEFYDMLDVPKSLRKTNHLQGVILRPALAEMEEKTKLRAEYKLLSKGPGPARGRRKLTHIELTVANNQPQPSLF